jgi:hypothetical protein
MSLGGSASLHDLARGLLGINLISFFGTYNGILGGITSEGQVWVLETDIEDPSWHPLSPERRDFPRLSHIAITSAEKVAVAIKAGSNASTFHVMEFESVDNFEQWYMDPVQVIPTPRHFQLGGRLKQLKARATGFTILTEAGQVYTWGDARHSSALGRVPKDNNSAEQPELVEALGGITITKIGSGGWVSAALSDSNDAYIWGMGRPGGHGKAVSALSSGQESDASDQDVRLINIDDDNGEPCDIQDIDVGDGHMALLTTSKRLLVCGEARNGQLGLGDTPGDFVEDWTEVQFHDRGPKQEDLIGVICGEKNTFVFAKCDMEGLLP